MFEEAKEETALRSAGEAMVDARDLQKIYAAGGATVHALRGVDLRIPRGEMVAVMGPSGCGKTTLLNCLSGLDEFDSGEVLIEGESIFEMSDRKRTRFRENIRQNIPGLEYVVPWGALWLVVVVGYAASLLTTYLPARQASKVYPAEALRYE